MMGDIPEMLVDGRTRKRIPSWFYRYACNPAAIRKEDIHEHVNYYSVPSGMCAGFEYYRGFI